MVKIPIFIALWTIHDRPVMIGRAIPMTTSPKSPDITPGQGIIL